MTPFFTSLLVVTAVAAHLQAPLTGVVFIDRNANAVRDAGERGVPMVAVSNQVAVVRTDATGRYVLPDAGLGVVYVSMPRAHRPAGAWWKRAVANQALDFGLVPSPEAVPFTFVHASDPHVAAANVNRLRRMVGLVDSIAPSLLLLTGDLVRDALRVGEVEASGYYRLFQEETRALRRPLFTVPGNHEIFGVERDKSGVHASHPLYGRAMYRSVRGPDYYAFDAGGVHFVALNTIDVDDQSYYGHVDSLQMAWLANDLALVPDSVPVVTFNHIPMYSVQEQMTGYSDEPPAPTLITVRGRTQFRHSVSNFPEIAAAMGRHRWEIALAGHVHHRESLALQLADRVMRFHQAAAVTGNASKAGLLLPSGVTLYTVRDGRVDDGRFVPIGIVDERPPAAPVPPR